MKRIVFTVTNDLNYDQRMIRICTSLVEAGYDITIIGRKNKNSTPLSKKKYGQKRLYTFLRKGFGFYVEYNIRLFFYLLLIKTDIICCIDLDTILPVWLASRLRNKKRVYDAHEYFSQQKEIITRPMVHRVWRWIEKSFVPKFKAGYTVSQSIADEFKTRYGVDYKVIRNLPERKIFASTQKKTEKFLLYQGAVNEARGLEFLIPAMKDIDTPLHIYGDGNFLESTKNLIIENNLTGKVFVKEKVLPEELDKITQAAYIGLNLVENNGLNQYYSLANKFFDYIQSGIPQVSMNYPEYKRINDEFDIAVLIDDLNLISIANAINNLLNDEERYNGLVQNCLKAREELNWQLEEKKLLAFYKNLF